MRGAFFPRDLHATITGFARGTALMELIGGIGFGSWEEVAEEVASDTPSFG